MSRSSWKMVQAENTGIAGPKGKHDAECTSAVNTAGFLALRHRIVSIVLLYNVIGKPILSSLEGVVRGANCNPRRLTRPTWRLRYSTARLMRPSSRRNRRRRSYVLPHALLPARTQGLARRWFRATGTRPAAWVGVRR